VKRNGQVAFEPFASHSEDVVRSNLARGRL